MLHFDGFLLKKIFFYFDILEFVIGLFGGLEGSDFHSIFAKVYF